MKKLFLVVILLVLVGGVYMFMQPQKEAPIGGDRDVHGCLGPAGYSFDETIGACVRGWELTPDIAEAARIAVEHVGRSYALTVVSFNSYEEGGAYDITLERGEERTQEIVYIRGGEVVTAPSN